MKQCCCGQALVRAGYATPARGSYLVAHVVHGTADRVRRGVVGVLRSPRQALLMKAAE
jgi:hypothetical protein